MPVILDSVVTVMASCLTVSVLRRKIMWRDRITGVIASHLTLFVPSWNRIAVTLDRVVMVISSCLTVRVPRRKIITLDRITVVMASRRPCLFPVATEEQYF